MGWRYTKGEHFLFIEGCYLTAAHAFIILIFRLDKHFNDMLALFPRIPADL